MIRLLVVLCLAISAPAFAKNGNSNAGGLPAANEAIGALESDVETLTEEVGALIRQMEALANQRCPDGEVVVGFDQDRNIICEEIGPGGAKGDHVVSLGDPIDLDQLACDSGDKKLCTKSQADISFAMDKRGTIVSTIESGVAQSRDYVPFSGELPEVTYWKCPTALPSPPDALLVITDLSQAVLVGEVDLGEGEVGFSVRNLGSIKAPKLKVCKSKK